MTVAVTNRTTAPVGLGGVDRDAGAPLRGRAAGRALLDAWGLPDPRALTDLRAALMGSSFLYAGAQDDDGQTRTPGWLGAWSAWGRGAASWFSGANGGASLEGEVATGMLGVDSRWGRWRAGVVVSHSRGQGTYTPPTAPGGAVASTLTALHPYAGYDVNARTSVWGVVGYGVGEVSLTPARATPARETDLTNTMAAVGGRAALSVRSGRAGRFELALRSDARLTNTAADAVAGLLGATERTRHGGVLIPRILNARCHLGNDRLGFGWVLGMLRAADPISVWHMAQHQRLETIRRVSTERVQWCPVARVREVIRELNDLRHASEVLSKHDVLAESDLGVAVQAALSRERVVVRDTVQVVSL